MFSRNKILVGVLLPLITAGLAYAGFNLSWYEESGGGGGCSADTIVIGQNTSDTGFAGSANDWNAGRFQATCTGNINRIGATIQFLTTGEMMTCGIYADSAGALGAKIADTAEYTGTDNTLKDVDLTLDSPVAITSGTYYWLLCHLGANATLWYIGSGTTNAWKYGADTYSSGTTPATPTLGGTTSHDAAIWGKTAP